MIFGRIRAVFASDQFAIAVGGLIIATGLNVLNDVVKRRRTELADLDSYILDRRADVVALDERVADRLAHLDDIARAYPAEEDVNPLHAGEDDRG